MMKYLPNKIILFVAVISIGVWFWANRPKEVVVEKPMAEAIEENILADNLPKEIPKSEEVFEYSTENDNKLIKFDINKLNFEFKEGDDELETTLVVKLGTKTLLSKKYMDTVLNISKIFFKDKIIMIVNYYSGGAHCCSMAVPYLIDGEKITAGKGLDLGNIDIFNGGAFFIKDDKLIALSRDDRFAYYEMSYADSGSMFFPSFFELSLDSLEFTEVNSLFTDLYAKYYVESQKDVITMVTKENCAKDEVGKYPTFGSLVSRYTYGFLSGVDRAKLQSELGTSWWCFPEKDLNKVEESIYSMLNGTSNEDFQSDTIIRNYDKFSN